MVLALISTACISNVIYSLQAMLIYARISNPMEAEDRTLLECFSLLMFRSFSSKNTLKDKSSTGVGATLQSTDAPVL